MKEKIPASIPFKAAAASAQAFTGVYKLTVDKVILDYVLDECLNVQLALQFFNVPKDGLKGRITTRVNLKCQRTEENFVLPINVEFALVADANDDEDAVTLDEAGNVVLDQLIQEELLLALPLVPIKPGTEAFMQSFGVFEEVKTSSRLEDIII